MRAATLSQARVFVSSPAALTNAQAGARSEILRELDALDMETFAIDRSQYTSVPWQQLRHAVASAHGMVVCGFGQLHVIAGEWRPGTSEARRACEWYPTPWNQIEAGLAIMARVPVLVTADGEVNDGVFSVDVWGDCVFGLSAHSDTLARNEVLARWATAVFARTVARPGQT